ncbi:hypothetical protein [Luteolibacter soli]|uniref:Uncharacterized protein n=1 Tax=Luteolibacter soli TaxID=3135280 RepID=A0ABU9AQQ3_9BACT
MKSPLSTGVVLMAVAGVSAYAVAALMSEANLRTGTVTRSPFEAIAKSVATLRTDRHLHDAHEVFPQAPELLFRDEAPSIDRGH